MYIIALALLGLVLTRAIRIKIWKKRRSIPEELVTSNDYLLYLRNLKAYDFARSQINHGMKVLDVGCWNGYGTAYLAQKKIRVLGIDNESDKRDSGASILDVAVRKYGNLCKFKKANLEDLPSDSFDCVVCYQVIEHIDNDLDFLNEIKRVLRKNGVAYISTVNRELRLLPNEKVWNSDHIREYTLTKFKKTVLSVFPETYFYGVKGNKKANQLERERIKIIKSKNQIKQMVKVFIGFNKNKYDLTWFKISTNNISRAWDFIAVCKKD